MVALNFPDSPTPGQQFTSGLQTWEWDTVSWNILPTAVGGGEASIAVGPTEPVGPDDGDLWWDTDEPSLLNALIDPDVLAINAAFTSRYVAVSTWTNFTPILTAGVTITKTVNYARYIQYGKLIIANVLLTITGVGTANATVNVGLPISINAGLNLVPIGMFWYQDSGTAIYNGAAIAQSNSTVVGQAYGTVNAIGSSMPQFTTANGDIIGYSVMYEAA